jgi:hypothetical protein
VRDQQTTDEARLELRWVPVADGLGRTRMEAVWIEASTAPATTTVHHAA